MADRELVIRFRLDTAGADMESEAFWRREAARQARAAEEGAHAAAYARQQASQQAANAQPAGGGAAGGPAAGGGLPGMMLAVPAAAAQQPMAVAGVLPGNAPGAFPAQAGNAAAGGALPGMILPIPGAAAAAQLGAAGGPGARAALPQPPGVPAMQAAAGGPAMAALPAPGAAAQQPIMNVPGGVGGGGMQLFGPGGAPPPIPVTPTPVATPPGAKGGGGGGMSSATEGALTLGVLATARRLAQGAAESAKDADAYNEAVLSEGAAARKQNREIMALRHSPNTAASAAQLAQEAANTGISEDQWRDFQVGFQAYGGQYVGEGKEHKIGEEQSQRLQQRVAGYAVGSRGWSGRDASRLLGTVISKSKKGASDEDILGQYGQLAEVLQLAPGYTGPLMGQLSEVVGEAVGDNGDFKDALDASILLRGVSERNPASASAYTRAVLRGLRRARGNPEMAKELGLKEGMGIFEQLEAIEHASDEAKARTEASGHAYDEGQFMEQHGFSEIRQYGGIRTALDSGLRGGGFKRARAEAGDRAARARKLEAEFQEYRSGEEGQAAGSAAARAAARLNNAASMQALEKYRQRARVSVEASGEQGKSEGLLGGFMQGETASSLGDRIEQETRAETARAILNGLRNSRAGREYLKAPVRAPEGLERALPSGFNGIQSREQYLEGGRGAELNVLKDMANKLEAINRSLQEQGRQAASRPGSAAAITVQQPGAGDGR